MPLSRDAAIRAWEPMPLTAVVAPAPDVTLPEFEATREQRPPQSFEVSTAVGVPADVLAAARSAARAAGYADGWTAGLRDAKNATAAHLAAEQAAAEQAAAERHALTERAFAAVDAAAEKLARREVTAAREIEEEIVAAAWAMAEGILGHALDDGRTRSRAALQRALALAPSDDQVRVTVSAADFAILSATAGRADADAGTGTDADAGANADAGLSAGAAEPEMTTFQRRIGTRTVNIVLDPALEPGDAVATVGATRVDARLSAALARVREVLAA